jgi:hypothetical protein
MNETSPRRHSEAPPVQLITQALTKLLSLQPHLDRVQCAVHLALPEGELVGAQAKRVGNTWLWRGQCVDVTDPAEDPAEFALRIVAAGSRLTDTWLWPTGDPVTWLRFTHSGTRILAWGSRALFNGPRVTFTATVTAADRLLLARKILAREITSPAVVDATADTLFISGGPGWVHVSSSQDASAEPEPADTSDADSERENLIETRLSVAELLREVSGAALAEVVETSDPTRFEVRVRVGQHMLHVEVHYDGATLRVGTSPVPYTDDRTTTNISTPHGWELAGEDAHGRAVVERCGVLALVRPG